MSKQKKNPPVPTAKKDADNNKERKRSSVPTPKKIPANNKQGYKWRLVIDGPPDPVTGKRKQIPRVGNTQAEARAACQKEYDRLAGGINVKKAKKTTVESAALEWVEEIYPARNISKGTLRVRNKEIKIINRYMGKSLIDSVTKKQHQKMLNEMDSIGYRVKDKENPGQFIYKPYAKTTIEGVNTTAGMIFEWAVSEGLRKDDPTVGAVIPVKALTVEEIEEDDDLTTSYLERHELEEFLFAVQSHGLEGDLETFYLLAFSGMRSGEVCALKWSDVNFDTTMLRVTKSLYNPDNNMIKYELTPPKTTGSIRSFNIDEFIIDMLQALKERQAKVHTRYKAEFEDYHDKNFIFCRPNGYPFIQKSIINRMNRILKFTSITKHATPHIFRHTHISMLTEAGVDLVNIMKRVGHDDANTTMKIYTHVTDKMKQDDANKVKIEYSSLLKIEKPPEL
ncbi:tyrosine-type recombinase/integrase [Paenibacillus sp. RS8]|uniref:tyrosine-type recombinase/integrase n=1 Tax=Paenibacillus sp. RS8 TaxID=3242681 RepID=UPI0035C0048A